MPGVRFRPIAVLFVISLTLVACSQTMNRGEAVSSFQSSHPEANLIQAECVIDDLIARYESTPLENAEVPNLEAELLAVPRSAEFDLAQARALFRCGLRSDLEEQLGRQLEAAGFDPERTDCVAAALVPELTEDDFDVLLGSEMTDAFFERMFDAAEGCDALPA